MPGGKPLTEAPNGIVPSPELPEPSEQERVAISTARKKRQERGRPIRTSIQRTADGQLHTDASHSDGPGWIDCLTDTFGTTSNEFALTQLNFLMSTIGPDHSPDDRAMELNSMLAAVAGVEPRDETEGALAVQMAATHQLAMTLLKRAGRAQDIALLETNGNMAVKLLRTYAAQSEALAKLRQGGNQTMRVEHVHVHSGGQAIVGNVNRFGGGTGGGGGKIENQPHAPGPNIAPAGSDTAERGAALWRDDTLGETVPGSRGEWAQEVPDARRCKE